MLNRIPSGADIGKTVKVMNNAIGDIEARIAAVITQAANALSAAAKGLEKQIKAEAGERIAADEAEAQARSNEDSNLQAQINDLLARIEALENPQEPEDDDEEE